MNSITPELREFVEKYISNNHVKNVDLRNLNLKTSLDLDLNLFDLDIDFFLTEFIKEFNVTYNNFDWKKYGYPKGNYLINLIRSFLNYNSSWVKDFAHKVYKPKIRLEVLQRAIETGHLN